MIITPEQDTSNHQEEDEQPSTSRSSIQVSTRPVTFSELIPITKWERSLRIMTKLPNYHLTSIDHINYITTKNNKKTTKGKRKKRETKQE